MKKILFLLCGFVVVGWLISALAAGEKQSVPTDAQTDAGRLTQQIDTLQARIKSLEERLEKLEKERIIKLQTSSPPIINPTPNFMQLPGTVADPNRPPNAWGEREFNGLKYYMMPLNAGGN